MNRARAIATRETLGLWVAFCLVMLPAGSQADTFILKDGVIIEGTVLRALGSTLSIKLEGAGGAGMYQLPLSMIDRLEIPTADGGQVSGNLAWWADGAYVLVTDQGLIEVDDGVVSSSVTGPVGASSVESLPAQAIPVQGTDQDTVAPASSAQSLDDEQPPRKLEPTM